VHGERWSATTPFRSTRTMRMPPPDARLETDVDLAARGGAEISLPWTASSALLAVTMLCAALDRA